MRYFALLLVPAAVLVGVLRPAALLTIVLLGVVVAGLARTGLWLLDDLVDGNPDEHALRAGGGTVAAGLVLATSLLVLGPLTVLLIVPATLLAARLLRSGRPPWLRETSIG